MGAITRFLAFFNCSSPVGERQQFHDEESPPPYEDVKDDSPQYFDGAEKNRFKDPVAPQNIAPSSQSSNSTIDKLFEAAKTGDFATIQTLALWSIDINCTDDQRWTALHHAAHHGHANCVEHLLRYGAAPNVFSLAAETPMHRAAACKVGMQALSALWSQGGDIIARGYRQDTGELGNPVLYAALNQNNVAALSFLIDHGADINCSFTSVNMHPLHLAAYDGHTECVRMLLAAGCDLEHETVAAWTPLYVAVWQERSDIVSLLLDAGAKPNLRHVSELDIPHIAAESGNVKIMQQLLAKGMDVQTRTSLELGARTTLHRAALKNQPEMIKILLAAGVAVDTLSAAGDTPLLYAAACASLECCEILLAAGASIRVQTSRLSTLLHFAVENPNLDVVEWALGQGLNVNARTTGGITPFARATLHGTLATVQMLMQTPSVDIFTHDIDGCSALWCTSRSDSSQHPHGNRVDIAKVLVAAGLSPFERNNHGYKALCSAIDDGDTTMVQYFLSLAPAPIASVLTNDDLASAVFSRNIELVKLLLSRGVDVNSITTYGKLTALHVAVSQYEWDMMELLVNAGADATIPDQHGSTSLEEASLHQPTLEKLGVWARMNISAASQVDNRALVRAAVQNHMSLAYESNIGWRRAWHLSNLGRSLLVLSRSTMMTLTTTGPQPPEYKTGSNMYERLAVQAFHYSCGRTESGTPSHVVFCDSCRPLRTITGKWWLCTVCRNIGLCQRCYKKHYGVMNTDNGTVVKPGWRGCVGHRLIEIDAEGYERDAAWEAEVVQWLGEVRKCVTASFIGPVEEQK